MATITLEIGALCAPISEQLAGRLDHATLAKFDDLSESISICFLNGVISDSQTDVARRRLLKKIQTALNHARKT